MLQLGTNRRLQCDRNLTGKSEDNPGHPGCTATGKRSHSLSPSELSPQLEQALLATVRLVHTRAIEARVPERLHSARRIHSPAFASPTSQCEHNYCACLDAAGVPISLQLVLPVCVYLFGCVCISHRLPTGVFAWHHLGK